MRKGIRESYLNDCAKRAVDVFTFLHVPKSTYTSLLDSLFKDMESIYRNITDSQIIKLKEFGFDLRSMNLNQRRDTLFQMSLCRVLMKHGYVPNHPVC